MVKVPCVDQDFTKLNCFAQGNVLQCLLTISYHYVSANYHKVAICGGWGVPLEAGDGSLFENSEIWNPSWPPLKKKIMEGFAHDKELQESTDLEKFLTGGSEQSIWSMSLLLHAMTVGYRSSSIQDWITYSTLCSKVVFKRIHQELRRLHSPGLTQERQLDLLTCFDFMKLLIEKQWLWLEGNPVPLTNAATEVAQHLARFLSIVIGNFEKRISGLRDPTVLRHRRYHVSQRIVREVVHKSSQMFNQVEVRTAESSHEAARYHLCED